MAKPLRIREILDYLLDTDPNTGESRHSQNQISKTLGVSAVTVRKIERALNGFKKSNSVQELFGKSDIELEKLLFPSDAEGGEKQQKTTMSDEDLELLLDKLGNGGETLASLYDVIRKALDNPTDYTMRYGRLVASQLSKDGQAFIKEHKYISLYNLLRDYSKKKEYSDRLKFKKGEYLEIGVIPITAPKKSKEKQDSTYPSLKDMGLFLFYLYLPYSRRATILEVDTSVPDFTREMVTFMILFLNRTKGLTAKIVGEDRIGRVFKGADLKLLEDYFEFCGQKYASDKKHCVFKNTEKELIERTIKSLTTKKQKSLPSSHQKRIDNECEKHNEEDSVKITYKNEKTKLEERPYPRRSFSHDIGNRKLQPNNYILFEGCKYSSKYTCKEPKVAIEFTNGEINLITKETVDGQDVILSRHKLLAEYGYSTNPEDFAPDNQTARDYGLWTKDYLVKCELPANYTSKFDDLENFLE